MIEVFLEEMHFKFLNCRNGPTNDYWTRIKYTSIIKKIESWMGDVQRWNVIFMLVKENVEHI